MKKITEEAVLEERNKTKRNKTNEEEKPIPRRLQFQNYTGVQKEKANPTFSVPFECVKEIFGAQTGISLRYNDDPIFKNYWRFVTEEQICQIETWEKSQGTRVFLRDCLSLSIALDFNFLKKGESIEYTEIGALEDRGKRGRNESVNEQLAEAVAKTINELPFYKDADLVCAIPPRKDKGFDLPGDVTSLVSKKIGKQDVTDDFTYDGQKVQIKDFPFEERWERLKEADLSFKSSTFDVMGKTIVLIDDKYQSGTTIQHVAMKLQKAGASQIYGLCFVKTLRDTDNVR